MAEEKLGLSPLRLRALYPGRYRIYLQRPGAQGRVHPARVVARDGEASVCELLLKLKRRPHRRLPCSSRMRASSRLSHGLPG